MTEVDIFPDEGEVLRTKIERVIFRGHDLDIISSKIDDMEAPRGKSLPLREGIVHYLQQIRDKSMEIFQEFMREKFETILSKTESRKETEPDKSVVFLSKISPDKEQKIVRILERFKFIEGVKLCKEKSSKNVNFHSFVMDYRTFLENYYRFLFPNTGKIIENLPKKIDLMDFTSRLKNYMKKALHIRNTLAHHGGRPTTKQKDDLIFYFRELVLFLASKI